MTTIQTDGFRKSKLGNLRGESPFIRFQRR